MDRFRTKRTNEQLKQKTKLYRMDTVSMVTVIIMILFCVQIIVECVFCE